jgi:exodeoxyribonuclease VII small subunit
MESKEEVRRGSFEESLNRLGEIITLLEDENLTLEQSLSLFEEGVHLTRECTDRLEALS